MALVRTKLPASAAGGGGGGGGGGALEAGSEADSESDEDGLHDPWKPPSWGAATAARVAALFQGGAAPLWGSSIESVGDECGTGISLYLTFLRTLALFFAAASVLALPALLANASGRGIPRAELDALGFERFSFGNQGM